MPDYLPLLKIPRLIIRGPADVTKNLCSCMSACQKFSKTRSKQQFSCENIVRKITFSERFSTILAHVDGQLPGGTKSRNYGHGKRR
jgi:hypothetical protein